MLIFNHKWRNQAKYIPLCTDNKKSFFQCLRANLSYRLLNLNPLDKSNSSSLQNCVICCNKFIQLFCQYTLPISRT